MRNLFPYLNTICVRKLFLERKGAQESLSSLPFPCDDLVAVPIHGIDVKKIKEENSIELKLNGEFVLETADGCRLLNLSSRIDSRRNIGDVYEKDL